MAKDNSKTGPYQPLPSLANQMGINAKSPQTNQKPVDNSISSAFSTANSGNYGFTGMPKYNVDPSKIGNPVINKAVGGLVTGIGNIAKGIWNTPVSSQTNTKVNASPFPAGYNYTAPAGVQNFIQPKTDQTTQNQTTDKPKTIDSTKKTVGANNSDATKVLQDELVKGNYMQQSDLDNGGYGVYGPKTTAAVAKRDADLKAKQNQSIGGANSTGSNASNSGATVNSDGTVNTPNNNGLIGNQNSLSTGLPGYVSTLAQGGVDTNAALAQKSQEIADAAGKAYADVGQQGARGEAGYLTTGTTPVAQGNAAIIAQNIAAQQKAISEGAQMQQTGVTQGLTAQSQTQSALNNAAGLYPEGLRYTLPVGASTGNSIIDNSISRAAQLIANGSTTADAINSTSLSTYGPLGVAGLTKLMLQYDPNWSPTASNAIAQQNMTQGSQYQGQAANLDVPLQGLIKVEPQVTSLLSQAALNPTNIPFLNESINKYKSQADPASRNALTAGMAEIQNYTSQILGNSGELTPTQVTSLTSSFDPGNFNPQQLSQFLASINNYGQARLQVLQKSSKLSYRSGMNPYSGTTANPSATSPTMSSGFSQNGITGLNLNTGTQAVVGLGSQGLVMLKDFISSASGLASNLFGAATGI